MTDSGVEYETQTVRAIRGTENRTVAKWERAGWEAISQSPGRVQTEISLRRPKPRSRWKLYAIGGGALTALLAVVIVNGVITENYAKKDDEAAAAVSEAPERSDEAAAEESKPTESAVLEPAEPVEVLLTPETNGEFAELLTLGNYCDPSVSAFAEQYDGQTVSFDGYIGAMNPRDGATTRYDILIGAGDFSEAAALGPSFQFRDVNTTRDLHYTGDVPDSIGVGQNLHLTAEVVEYEQSSCLFVLKPVETSFR